MKCFDEDAYAVENAVGVTKSNEELGTGIKPCGVMTTMRCIDSLD